MGEALQPPLDGGPLRLEVDARSERQIVLTRAVLGLLVVACAAWLMRLPERVPQVVGLFGLVFAVLWLVRGTDVLRKPKTGEVDFLELGPDDLWLHEQGRDLRIAWRDVQQVGIDHDRLTVVLLLRSGKDFHLEPRYRGVPLEALRDAIGSKQLSHNLAAQSPDARANPHG